LFLINYQVTASDTKIRDEEIKLFMLESF